MTQREFERTVRSFDAIESMRGRLYHSALKLIRAGFTVEAHVLLLATWNFARFRYVIPSFNLRDYEALLQRLAQKLRPLIGCDIATADLTRHRNAIIDAFDALAAIRGVEFTGTAKVLHLLNPGVFVMWDSAISGWHTPKADYARLDVVRSGFWRPRTYPFARSGRGYHEFLAYCQTRFQNFISPSEHKTLAKCIDEFNYCSISKRLQARKPRSEE